MRDDVEKMIAALRHRGPDGTGFFVEGPIALGHSRLSIIDLEGGAQPIANEDGRIRVTFNGEIFNYVELRRDLIRRGHRLATASDTEVLVHLYEEHGDRFVERLNGQFAFALWDGKRQRLLLARDRVGIRPLYYTWAGGQLVFASEVKALFTRPDIVRVLDPMGLASTLSYWAVLPPRSVFAGVHTLPPGHTMAVDATRVHTERFWDWPFGRDAPPESEEAAAEELRELLIDALRLQLRADVPVGAYLSGGLDSSIVVALVRKHTETPLRTFSLTFEDSEFDESSHQQELVAHLGTQHSSMRATRAAIAAAFPRMVWHAEAPVVRTAPVPMMLLADSVKAAHYKVVLTGEGADEAFGGYDLFKEAKLRRWVAQSPNSSARRALVARLYPYLEHSPAASLSFTHTFFGADNGSDASPWYAHASRLAVTRRALQFFRAEWRERLAAWDPHQALVAMLPADFAHWQPLERDQYVEAHTLLSGYLLSSQGDRMAMAASVEARFPFLDHRVLELSCRLPPRYKLRALEEKVLLKRTFRDALPPSIVQRPKQPYRAPDSACFFRDGRAEPWVEELLSDASLDSAGIFDRAAVAKLMRKCRAGRAIGFGDNIAFVSVLSTMLLHEQLVRPPQPMRFSA